jgi:hypothetical protein
MPKEEQMISPVVIEVMDQTLYDWEVRFYSPANPDNYLRPVTTYTGTLDMVNRIAAQMASRSKVTINKVVLVRKREAR